MLVWGSYCARVCSMHRFVEACINAHQRRRCMYANGEISEMRTHKTFILSIIQWLS